MSLSDIPVRKLNKRHLRQANLAYEIMHEKSKSFRAKLRQAQSKSLNYRKIKNDK